MKDCFQILDSAQFHQVKEELLAKQVDVNSKSIISLAATVFVKEKQNLQIQAFSFLGQV